MCTLWQRGGPREEVETLMGDGENVVWKEQPGGIVFPRLGRKSKKVKVVAKSKVTSFQHVQKQQEKQWILSRAMESCSKVLG